jgi:hypothetical protein
MSGKAITSLRTYFSSGDGADLKPSERHVLLVLATYHNESKNAAWPSVRTLATQVGLTERYVRKILKQLYTKDALSKKPRKNPTGYQSNLYSLPCLQDQVEMSDKDTSPELSATDPLSPGPDRKNLKETKEEEGVDSTIESLWNYYLTTFDICPELMTFTKKRRDLGICRIHELLPRANDHLSVVKELMEMAMNNAKESKFWKQQKRMSWEHHLFPNLEALENWLT